MNYLKMTRRLGRIMFCCVALAGVSMASAGQPGQICWSEAGGIYRSDTDGSDRVFIAAGFQIGGIASADELGLLTWSDVPPTVPIGPSGIIVASELDGSVSRVVARGVPQPAGVAVDPSSGETYWTDLESNQIRRSLADGVQSEVILAEDPNRSQMVGLAFDDGQLYFSFVNPLIDSLFPGGIARVNTDGTNLQFLITGLANPAGIAVDRESGLLFWADSRFGAGGVIGRANLDGSDSQNIISNTKSPFGLAIDPTAKQLYWTDTAAGTIHSAGFNGQDIAEVFAQLDQPRAMTFASVPEPHANVLVALAVCGTGSFLGWQRRHRRPYFALV